VVFLDKDQSRGKRLFGIIDLNGSSSSAEDGGQTDSDELMRNKEVEEAWEKRYSVAKFPLISAKRNLRSNLTQLFA
jgi:hypothetical protein